MRCDDRDLPPTTTAAAATEACVHAEIVIGEAIVEIAKAVASTAEAAAVITIFITTPALRCSSLGRWWWRL